MAELLARFLKVPSKKRGPDAGVAAATLQDVLAILSQARENGFSHQGSLGWAEANGDRVERWYVIPLLERPECADTVPCALLVCGERNRFGWMRVSVLRAQYRRLRRCGPRDVNFLALNLAVRGPLLKGESDVLMP